MPIELFTEGTELKVSQSFARPAIYFDHWAICTFAEDSLLKTRLVQLVHEKNATFLLSHTNLAEFTKASDLRHALAAEVMLDELMPHIYLTDFDLNHAEKWELELETKEFRLCPSPDLPMLQFLARLGLKTHGKIVFKDFVRLSHEYRNQIGDVFQEVNNNILNVLKLQKEDPAFLKKAKTAKPNNNRTNVKVVMGELMRELTLDPSAIITLNDIVDWQHAVIPLLSCDFVLLDKKWKHRVDSLKKRFVLFDVKTPLATCYSAHDDGVQNFLNTLENFA